MGQVATRKVKHLDGFMVINASDFNPKVHEAYAEPKADDAGGKKADAKAKKADDAGGKK